jgi:hypothetical protein
MPQYRILYLKDSEVERFRQAAPKDKPDQLSLKHYEEVGRIDAPSAYSAWKELQERSGEETQLRPMGVGDVLEVEGEKPLLCHFWGFEEAEWRQPAEHAGAGFQVPHAVREMASAGTDSPE